MVTIFLIIRMQTFHIPLISFTLYLSPHQSKAPRMKKDISSKETIKAITEEIGRYILHLEISDIEFVDKELQRVEKREADIIALCKIN